MADYPEETMPLTIPDIQVLLNTPMEMMNELPAFIDRSEERVRQLEAMGAGDSPLAESIRKSSARMREMLKTWVDTAEELVDEWEVIEKFDALTGPLDLD